MNMLKLRLRDHGSGADVQGEALRGDSVQWQNQTDTPRTLKFAVWPFSEAQQAIVIGAKDRSNKYTVADATITRPYPYTIDPPLDDGPPDGPSISVGD